MANAAAIVADAQLLFRIRISTCSPTTLFQSALRAGFHSGSALADTRPGIRVRVRTIFEG